jgi:glutathione S-transferase
MITIHHLGVSQSDRVVWLMEELNLPYKLVWHQREADGMAPQSLLALHPAATAPLIADGELVLTESEAILPYICHQHAGGRLTVAAGSPYFADYLFGMTLNNNLLGLFFSQVAATESTPTPLKAMLKRRVDGYVRYIEDRLARQPYLAGDAFTCADIMIMFALRFPQMLGGREDMPNARAYVQRLSQRPAFIKADALAGLTAKPPQP